MAATSTVVAATSSSAAVSCLAEKIGRPDCRGRRAATCTSEEERCCVLAMVARARCRRRQDCGSATWSTGNSTHGRLDVLGDAIGLGALLVLPSVRTSNHSASSRRRQGHRHLHNGSTIMPVQTRALQDNDQSDGKGEVSASADESVQPAPLGQQNSRSQEDDGGVDLADAAPNGGSVFVSEFKVDMMCEGCVNRVTKALQSLEGVQSFDINLKEKFVSVKGTATVQSLEQSFSSVGRSSELISQKPV